MKRLLIAIVLLAAGFLAGFYAGHRDSRSSDLTKQAAQAPAATNEVGQWKARFRFPGSVQMPDAHPLIRYDFQDAPDASGFAGVTITNLSDRPYVVDYHVYGYDSEGRRVSDGEDEFAIGRRESVVRKILLVSQAPVLQREFGATFSVEMSLKK